MKWTDGSIYQGEWVKGIQHGYGKMIFPNGVIKEGYFEFNIYKGPKGALEGASDGMRSTKASNFYAGPNPNAKYDLSPSQQYQNQIQLRDLQSNLRNTQGAVLPLSMTQKYQHH